MSRYSSATLACVVAGIFQATANAQSACTSPDFCTPKASFVSTQTTPEDARFGTAVALKGDVAIVGASHDSHGSTWNRYGAAYVYRNEGSTWVEEARLTASDALPGDLFGSAVAIDGEWAMVGNYTATCSLVPGRCGAVYAFTHDGSDWSQVARLVPSDLQPDDSFGISVALDGNWAAIGGVAISGGASAIYLFELAGGAWIERQKLESATGFVVGSIGELDSGRLMVNVMTTPQSGEPNGGVAFYRLNGGTWVLDALFENSFDSSGVHRLSLNGDDAIAGFGGFDCPDSPCAAADIYLHNGLTWIRRGTAVPSNPGGPEFSDGWPVSVEGDRAIIGLSKRVFHRNRNNTWSEVGRLGAVGSGMYGDGSIKNGWVLTGGYDTATNKSAAFFFDLTQMASDCNCDGQTDSCDAALEGIGDCQENGVVDSCDIFTGLSVDCGGDLIPDECQSDCQSNGIEDSCDIAAGSEDCNTNSKPDECELSYFDCNLNGRPDDCDTSEPSGIPNSCTCIATLQPQPDPTDLPKGRFISFVPGNPGHWKAIRVKLVSLHHVSPPYTGAPSIPFSSHEGRVLWVGPPSTYVESSSDTTQFYASTLQCAPHYRDWSTIEILHVTGSAIVPSSTYDVQFMGANCNPNLPGSYSSPLNVQTGRWGDVIQPFASEGAPGQPDFGDVSAMVNKFRSAPGAAKKVQTKLSSSQSTGELNLVSDVGFESISAAVDAFRGAAYPYTIASCP